MDPIPDEVRRFLDENVESVDQLEVLRILGEDPAREWAAGELAGELQADPQALSSDLVALHSRGLLKRAARGTEVFCQYGPATPELADALGLLLRVYLERPVTMIRLVSTRASRAIRSFAEAFRFRKEG